MIYIGTQDGVYRWHEPDGPFESIGLPGRRIRDLAIQPDGAIVAVESGERVWAGRLPDPEWADITPGVDAGPTTVLSRDGDVYLGAEPPVLYRRDGDAWRVVEPLHERDYVRHWSAPGGLAAVRSLAPHPGNDAGLYLDIHVGGIMRTLDGGATWSPASEGLEMDVHQVATHPKRPEAVYAATADGFYYSPDEGDTWERRNHGLDNLYTRGIAIHPEHPDLILLSGSPTPPPGWRRHGKRFAVYRTDNAGRRWHRITHGLPEEIDTFCLAFSRTHPDHAYAGRRDGVLHRSRDAGATWETATEGAPGIYAVKTE